MDEKDHKQHTSEENHFLSRGCCHAPQIYHDNSHIAKHRCCKLDTYDWLSDLSLPKGQEPFDCVEVRFKNSRKDFYRLQHGLELEENDIVAVEASPGHDIGIVTLKGEAVRLQMRKKGVEHDSEEIKKVYRRARLSDIEKWLNAVEMEERAQMKTRKIAGDLGLMMKINDVEYQGDETKAIFYYTADERVDFRELIKVLAEEFKVRIEMRQIGARQEAARLGGIGSCGRELCCATWLTDFSSVTTNRARIQQLSLNPQKLAGQCGKLKCCLNFENDIYLDALKEFPDQRTVLKTKKGEATHQKSDIFKKIMWYSYDDDPSNLMALTIENVRKIIEENKKGNLPETLEETAITREQKADYETALEEEDISRFDNMEEKTSKKRRSRKKRKSPGSPQDVRSSRDRASSGRGPAKRQTGGQGNNSGGRSAEGGQRNKTNSQRRNNPNNRQNNNPKNRNRRPPAKDS